MIGPQFSPDFIAQLDLLFRWRRDVRHFDTRPLAAGLLDQLLDQAMRAPSVGYSQPWRFVRVCTPARRNAIIAHVEQANARAASLYEGAQRTAYDALKLHGLKEAPEHLAVFCDIGTATGHHLGRRTMPETLIYSTVMAIHHLWLAARAQQIGLGWVSILEPTKLFDILDIPTSWQFIGYLCLGYPTEAADVPELEREGWEKRLDHQHTRLQR